MSKSLKRVQNHAAKLGLDIEIIETPSGTHTAAMAADFCGCDSAQIAKSILFTKGDELVMFITSGAHRVDTGLAEKLVGEPLGKADAAIIRSITGFAIGGVSPLGSLTHIKQYFDRSLLQYDKVFAAAGTPHHLFAIKPAELANAVDAEISDFTS